MWQNKKNLKFFFLVGIICSVFFFSFNCKAIEEPTVLTNYGGLNRFFNSSYPDLPRDVKIDANGLIYLVGHSWGGDIEDYYSGTANTGYSYSTPSDNTILLQYQDLGGSAHQLFRDIWQVSNKSDAGFAIAIDNTKKVLYVVGGSEKEDLSDTSNIWDLMVLRYDLSSGTPQRLGNPWIWDSGYNIVGMAAEVDSAGYLYISGIWTNSGAHEHLFPYWKTGVKMDSPKIFTIKLDPTLLDSATSSDAIVWYREYGIESSSYGLALDETLNIVYVSGMSEEEGNGLILRYNTNDGSDVGGVNPWINYDTTDGETSSEDEFWDIILDSNRNPVVVGHSVNFDKVKYERIKYVEGSDVYYGYATYDTPYDSRIIKFDKNTGDIIFNKLYDTVYDDFLGGFDIDGDEIKGGLEIDPFGNLILTGFYFSGNQYNLRTLKIASSTKKMLWDKTVDSDWHSSSYNDFGSGVEVDSVGDNYTIGYGKKNYLGLETNYWWLIKRSREDPGRPWVRESNILWKKDTYDIFLKGKPFGIDLDESENPVVCGVKTNGSTKDFAIVKFSSSTGDILWKQIYDTGNDDEARDVCVDNDGFIYLAGNTYNGTDYDWLLIKYDPDHLIVSTSTDDEGNIITTTTTTTTIEWLMTYDSGGNDKVFGVACQATGTFYITGFQDVSGTEDILTIKYDTNTTSSTSTILWKHIWDAGDEDVGYDLSLDKDGYLYLVGKTNNGSNLDYLIVKYDTNSTTSPIIWQKTFDNGGDDFATAIAIDNFSSTTPLIYLGGSSFINSDTDKRYDHTFNWYLIKLDANGNILNNPFRNIGTSHVDLSWDIGEDLSGNFYIAGSSHTNQSSWMNIKRDTNGNLLKTVSYAVGYYQSFISDLAFFPNSVYVVGVKVGDASSQDFSLRKFDLNLNQVWETEWGSCYDDWGKGVALGEDFVYLTWDSDNAGNNSSIRFTYFRRKGNYTCSSCVKTFTYNSWGRDRVAKVKVDSDNNIILAGTSYYSDDNKYEWRILKTYDDGDLIFNKTFDNGDSNYQGKAYDLDLDENDNIYVVGTEIVDLGGSTTTRMRVAKFSGSDGSLIWTRMHSTGEEGYGIVVDKNSNWLYIVGTELLGAGGNKSLIVLRCKKDGSSCDKWQDYHKHSDQRGYDIALDSKGDVFVTGATKQINWNYLILKWSSSSMLLGEKLYDAYNTDEFAKGIAIDALNRVVVTGTTYNPGTGHYEILTQKYKNDLTGSPIWSTTYGENDKDYYAEDVACERGKNRSDIGLDERFMDYVYIGGYKYKPDTDDFDAIFLRYREYCSGPFPNETIFSDEDVFSTSSTSTFLIRSVHFKELRNVCDGLLKNCASNYYNSSKRNSKIGFSSSEVEPEKLIRVKHLTGLRDALKEVYNQCGQILPTFSDDPITAGETLIRKIHIKELQDTAKTAK